MINLRFQTVILSVASVLVTFGTVFVVLKASQDSYSPTALETEAVLSPPASLKNNPPLSTSATTHTQVNIPPATANQPTNQVPNNTQPSAYKQYLCTTTVIPYSSVARDDPTALAGETWIHPGANGARYYCPKTSTMAGMDDTVPPSNQITYTGTKPVPLPEPTYVPSRSSGPSPSQCLAIDPGSAQDYCYRLSSQ